MRGPRRVLATTLFLLPLVGLGTLSYFIVSRYFRMTKQDLKPLIGEEIRKITGHEVVIDDYTIRGGFAYVYGVKMSRGPTFASSAGKTLASAREVILDFDLGKILLEKNPRVPLFAHLQVIDPTAYIARDHKGEWNFMDIFRKGGKPPPRPAIGSISFVNGRITYEDASGFHNPSRPPAPFNAAFRGLHGHVDFFFDHSVAWSADAQETTGVAGAVRIVGSYVPGPEQIYLHIRSDRVAATLVGPLMPPLVDLTAGYVGGQVSLLRRLDARGKEVFDIEAQSTVHDVTAKVSSFDRPFTGIDGEATVTYPTVTAKLDASFVGSRLHTEGTILDLTSPTFHGWITGTGLQLDRLMGALRLKEKYPALNGLAASANVRANYTGTQQNLVVGAAGPARVAGVLPGGTRIREASNVQVQFSGSLAAPRFVVAGSIPQIRYRQYTARNVGISAVYTGTRATADFRASVGGGTIAGRADIRPNAKQTAYAVSVRARGVDLSKLPRVGPRALGGIASADVSLHGRLDRRVPDGSALVQVSDFKLDTYRAQNVRASIVAADGAMRVEPLVIRDPAGLVIASGSVDTTDQTIDMHVDADELNLARIPLPPQMTGVPIYGYAYLRDGRITGALSDPSFSGAARGYNIRVGDRLQLDYVTARASGDRKYLHVTEGQAWRFPGFATVSGMIRDPLGSRAQLDMEGAFERVDLEDIASMVGTDIRATGAAQGSFKVEGYIRRPIVTAGNVKVVDPSIGGFAFDGLQASLVFDGARTPGVLDVRSFKAEYSHTGMATVPDVAVSGSASVRTDRSFTFNASARNVDLKLLQTYIGEYAEVSGTGDVVAEVHGRIGDAPADLAGEVVANTRGLTLNRVDFGDLVARLDLQKDTITGSVHPATAVLPGVSPTGDTLAAGVHIDNLTYALAGPDRPGALLTADGRVSGLTLQSMRAALANSPYMAAHEDTVVANWLKPAATPLEGTMDAKIHVSGAPADPDVKLTWSANGMVVAGQPVQDFHGDVSLNRRVVVLSAAMLRADTTVVTADGSLVRGGSIEGDVSVNNLPLRVLRSWFPARPELAQLTGTVNEIDVRAAGQTRDPSITATFDLENIRWIDPDPSHPAVEINLPRVRTSAVTLEKGKLSIADLGIQIQEPVRPIGAQAPTTSKTHPSLAAVSPATGTGQAAVSNIESAQLAPRPTYTVYGSGSIDVSWDAPYITQDSRTSFQMSVKNQGLGLLTSVFPKVNVTLDGTIKEASLAYVGSLGEILGRPAPAGAEPGTAPRITGNIDLAADRIAAPTFATQIRDVAARLVFDGSTLRADSFTARTQIVTAGTASSLSDPITISGALPISEATGAPGLEISMPKLVLAASPLPKFTSGGVFGEVTTTEPSSRISRPLTVTGTLFSPKVVGTVYVQNTLFRLPSTFQVQAGPAIAFPVVPTFDLRIVGAKNIHVSGGQPGVQINAYVVTSPTEPIHIAGPIDDPQITGTMVVERGTFALPTMRYNVVRGGTVSLRYPYYPLGTPEEKSIVAVLNVDATTSLTAASVTGRARRYTITVEARGPINGAAPLQVASSAENPFAAAGLHLTFRSDPPDLAVSPEALQQRMIGMMGGQQTLEQLFGPSASIGQALASQFTDILSASLLPQLVEQTGIARALGLEEFQIGYNRLDAFTLQVSRNLLGPFYISYWRRLSGANLAGDPERAAWELKFSYRVRSNLQLSYTSDEQHKNAYLLEGVFRF